MEKDLPLRLATLGHPQRLAIFRLLMRRHPDRVAAGEIAEVLNIRPSTLSSYLTALMQAGLVTQTREGTSLRYAINLQEVKNTFDTLFLDCCRGRPDLCAPLVAGPDQSTAVRPDPKFNVLFICTGNSARSIFAESILRRQAGDRFNAFSAGIRPDSEVNAAALAMLRTEGHDISTLHPKSLDRFTGAGAPRLDFVFTVCDRAADKPCPAWEGQPISAHWGITDPVKTEGSAARKGLAFQEAYSVLKNRVAAFSALPLRELDLVSRQRAVDDIGRQSQSTA